jgi:uncharacterized protein (DUF1800 family)
MRNITGFPRATRVVVIAATLLLPASLLQAQKNAVPAKTDARTVAHVLDRIGFGPRPGDIERVQQTGLAAYIDQQLHPERIADAPLTARLAEFSTLSLKSSELSEQYFAPADRARQQAQQQQARAQTMDATMTGAATINGVPAPTQPAAPPQPTPEQRQLQQRAQSVPQELMQAKLLRASLSDHQLEEVLVDFWFNHFNVFIGKGQVRQYLTEYERDAIRPYVLGNFRDMLGATAHSPAMLFYLDNFQSRAPVSGPQVPPNLAGRANDPRLTPQQRQLLTQRLQQQRPAGGLNENYARELMELHTLGVDGGYTQQDVIQVARILSGWTIDRPQQGGGFLFRPQWHVEGTKTVMGRAFEPAGEKEGERLLDMLALHPQTAHHLAYELAQRLVADDPPAALVDRAAKRYLETKGDLRELTRVIITSPEFFDPKYFSAKVKTPLEFVVSAVRATNANIVTALPMVQTLNQLGMPLYGAQPPTGYSMTADAWVNTGALLDRMNFSLQLVGLQAPARPAAGRGGQPPPGAPQAAGRQGQPPRPAPGLGQPTPQQRQALLNRRPLLVDVAAFATDTSGPSIDHAVGLLLAGGVSDTTRQVLAKATTPEQLVAFALGCPEFQKR